MGKLATKIPAPKSRSPLFQGGSDPGGQTTPIVCKETDPLPRSNLDPVSDAGRSAASSITTAKPKARQHSPQPRERRRIAKNLHHSFQAAVLFADQIGWPINLAITITWAALVQAGERNEGHCLWRPEGERETYLRKELARCRPRTPRRPPFVAVWGRDIGARMGLHIHLGLHWAREGDRSLSRLIATLERICGSPARARRDHSHSTVFAESVCGGWQIKFIYGRSLIEGALNWADYIAGQSDKHHMLPDIMGKAFGVSQAIGPAARSRSTKTSAS